MEKRGQFYIIGAVIIILVITSIVAISNYIYVKKQPSKTEDITNIMEFENLQQVQYAEYTKAATATDTTAQFLDMFSNYLAENINEDFSLIIIYGDISGGNISATIYNRTSMGNIQANFPGISTQSQGGSDVSMQNAQVVVTHNPGSETGTVNVTLIGGLANITETLPVLQGNNFVFVLTTSQDFNRYIQTNLNKTNV